MIRVSKVVSAVPFSHRLSPAMSMRYSFRALHTSFLSLFSVACFATFAPLLQAAEPDVLGIQLGMSQEAALELLQKALPGANVQSGELVYEGSPPVPVTFWQSATSSGETLHVALSGPPAEPVVISVSREIRFAPDKQPNYQTLLGSLTEKYGTPSFIDGNQQKHVWFLDDIGSDRALMARSNDCASSNISSLTTDSYAKNMQYAQFTQPFNPRCGRLLFVSLTRSPSNRELVSHMKANLTDHVQAREANSKTLAYISAANERLLAEEAAKAKGNTPAL